MCIMGFVCVLLMTKFEVEAERNRSVMGSLYGWINYARIDPKRL